MRKAKIWAIVNGILLIAVVLWNYTANSAGIQGNTVASLSDEYANLFTPAGYAFGIWGLIYLSLFAMATFWMKAAFSTQLHDDLIEHIGPGISVVHVLNIAWLSAWLTERTLISMLIMLAMLSILVYLLLSSQARKIETHKATRMAVWWPLSLYGGWITVATIANASALLAKHEITLGLPEYLWAAIMIATATIIYLLAIFRRDMLVYASVGVWALIAIAVRHWSQQETLVIASIVGALLLSISIVYYGFRSKIRS